MKLIFCGYGHSPFIGEDIHYVTYEDDKGTVIDRMFPDKRQMEEFVRKIKWENVILA